jgi:hypothetical protein
MGAMEGGREGRPRHSKRFPVRFRRAESAKFLGDAGGFQTRAVGSKNARSAMPLVRFTDNTSIEERYVNPSALSRAIGKTISRSDHKDRIRLMNPNFPSVHPFALPATT